jgi:hydrogenase/urease accessory protein HupE
MWDQFLLYAGIGKDHILDLDMGLDHLLFIIALTVTFHPRAWRRVLILITAFTIGHSATLALATLEVISVPVNLVEFFICVTILFTAVANLFTTENSNPRHLWFNYFLAMFFGLIHGLGFSNTLRALLMGSSDLLMPLFSFNVGLEFGQIIIVVIFSFVAWICMDVLGIKRMHWNLIISSAIAGMALMLIRERIPGILS